MFRFLTASPTWLTGKWLAYVLFLLVPGSLVVVGAWWLVRMRGGQALSWPALATEQYLTEATDLPDLERRMRVVERASSGPGFMTFNH